MSRLPLLSGCCVLLLASVAQADPPAAAAPSAVTDEDDIPGAPLRLALHRGTRQLGGFVSVTFSSEVNPVPPGIVEQRLNGARVGFSPSFGYLVSDHVELTGRLSFSTGFGDAYTGILSGFGANLGARYLFLTQGAVVPYVGIHTGPLVSYGAGTTVAWSVAVPAGILIALSRHVALDVGLELIANFGISNRPVGPSLIAPLGVLGVQSFF